MIPMLFLLLFLCFSSNHGLNAAQAQSTFKLDLNGHAPIVVQKSSFDLLKENELKRAANAVAIYGLFSRPGALNITTFEKGLEIDTYRIEKSERILDRYKKQVNHESPKSVDALEKLFKSLDNQKGDSQIAVANLEDDISICKRKRYKLPGDGAVALLKKIQINRLKLPHELGLSASLTEDSVTSIDMMKFAFMLSLDARYNELQTGLLKHF